MYTIFHFSARIYRRQSPAVCARATHTDLVSLKEAEDVLDSGVVGEALHPDQGTGLRQHRGGCCGCGRCCRVGLCCYCCRHCSWWGCEVAHCGGRNWGAAERQSVCVTKMQEVRDVGASKSALQLAVTLTWGNRPCSSCSYSCRGAGEGGSRPERAQGCVQWSEEAWEQPAGGAGREQPQREWQAGLGKQRRLWGETDLPTPRDRGGW